MLSPLRCLHSDLHAHTLESIQYSDHIIHSSSRRGWLRISATGFAGPVSFPNLAARQQKVTCRCRVMSHSCIAPLAARRPFSGGRLITTRLPGGSPAPLTARENRPPPVPSIRMRTPSVECLRGEEERPESPVSFAWPDRPNLSQTMKSPLTKGKITSIAPREGVHTPPPHVQMLRSSSSHISRERRMVSPRLSDLGASVRTDSPLKIRFDGVLLSPSPLSYCGRYHRPDLLVAEAGDVGANPRRVVGPSSFRAQST